GAFRHRQGGVPDRRARLPDHARSRRNDPGEHGGTRSAGARLDHPWRGGVAPARTGRTTPPATARRAFRGGLMSSVDVVIIICYLVAMPVVGLLLSGRQHTSQDYFVGNRRLPWWAVCFSVVATETSTLTVISVPTVAYLGTFTYLQLAIGYLIGRVVVAFWLLPG